MKTLIIEDDLNKVEQLSDHIKSLKSDTTIVVRQSFQSGLRELINERYDIILLDMSLPTFDIKNTEEGGPFKTYGGEEILAEMKRRGIVGNVIIVTQFESFGEGKNILTLDELNKRLATKYPENFINTIYYEAYEKNWRDEIQQLFESKNMVQND